VKSFFRRILILITGVYKVYIKKKNRINNPYNFYFVSNVMLFKIFYNVFLI
jgi:hypothetical protein